MYNRRNFGDARCMRKLRIAEPSAGKLTMLFLAVAALSVFALVWMGVRLLQLERALESQQLAELREAAADRIVAILGQMLEADERQLDPAPTVEPADLTDALILDAVPGRIRVRPKNALLYYPEMPAMREAAPDLFDAATRAEYREVNYSNAIEMLRRFLKSGDPPVVISARLRMARIFRESGRREEALDIYRTVANAPGGNEISFAGTPADLAARSALCELLEETGDRKALQSEAAGLRRDLQRGCWRLDRSQYIYYQKQVDTWIGSQTGLSSRLPLSAAASWLWADWTSGRGAGLDSSGRSARNEDGTSVTVLWRQSPGRLVALVAGPSYQKEQWFDPALKRAGPQGLRVCVQGLDDVPVFGERPAEGIAVSSRIAAAGGLPWTVTVSAADPAADLSHFAQRRNLMLAGLGTLALLVIAAGFLVSQSVARELAAARLKSDFVSAVSHEFRTPLTSMRQFTEILAEDDNVSVDQRRAFYRAQERATAGYRVWSNHCSTSAAWKPARARTGWSHWMPVT